MAKDKLTHKQTLFVAAYRGKAKGNATEAARIAGYKGNENTLKQVASENLAKPYIAFEIKKQTEKAIITADEILIGIREIFDDYDQKTNDRLKAAELLGKNLAMWTDKVDHGGSVKVEVEYVNDWRG